MNVANVAVLDYGSGNLRSAQRALEAVGANVVLTSDFAEAMEADGLVVPGVGAFAACMKGFRAVRGDQLVEHRLAGGRPVLAICVGMQIMFDSGHEHGQSVAGLGEWPGRVERLEAAVLPHMGWNTVEVPPDSVMFDGVGDQRFYFVHSYAVSAWNWIEQPPFRAPKVTWARHGQRFVAAIEHGCITATQFHPEKSGDAGLRLLRNWTETL